MSIRDLIQRRFGNSQLIGVKIREFLRYSDKPGYRLLHSLIAHHQGGDNADNFMPMRVDQTCKALGIETHEDLYVFVADPLANLAIHSLILDDQTTFRWYPDLKLETNTSKLTRAVLNANFEINDGFEERSVPTAYYHDGIYKILPVGTGALRDLLKHSKARGMSYIPEKRDCDDFAMAFMGELARRGYGDLAIGMIEFTAYDQANAPTYRHSLNFSVHEAAGPTDHYDIYLIDPASHEIWNDPSNTPTYALDQESIRLDRISVL